MTSVDALASLRDPAGRSHLQEIHFLWRPFLPDPDDDPVLELALAASCRQITIHIVKDYRGIEQPGVEALTPRASRLLS